MGSGGERMGECVEVFTVGMGGFRTGRRTGLGGVCCVGGGSGCLAWGSFIGLSLVFCCRQD